MPELFESNNIPAKVQEQIKAIKNSLNKGGKNGKH